VKIADRAVGQTKLIDVEGVLSTSLRTHRGSKYESFILKEAALMIFEWWWRVEGGGQFKEVPYIKKEKKTFFTEEDQDTKHVIHLKG